MIMEFLYKHRKIVRIIFLILIILIVGLLIFFLLKPKEKEVKEEIAVSDKYELVLFGASEIEIKQGEEYQEPGYYALLNNKFVTEEVKVNNRVNVNKEGVYLIIYKIQNISKGRVVRVLKNDESITVVPDKDNDKDNSTGDNKTPNSNETLKFYLLGDSLVNLYVGDYFKEPGVKAYYGNSDISNRVKITNNINTSIPGEYYVNYLLNYNGKDYYLTRKVIINSSLTSNLEINLVKTSSAYTNQNVTIKYQVNGNDFSYIKLPNGTKSNSKSGEYVVNTNGNYTFYAYTSNNSYKLASIMISNIDKVSPEGACTATTMGSRTDIEVAAYDKSGIASYLYNNTYTSNQPKYTINEKLTSPKVRIFDIAGNYKDITCKNETKFSDNYIFVGDSRTVMMCSAVKMPENEICIAKVGMGLSWLSETAVPSVNSVLAKNPNTNYNIIVDLGVNGLSSKNAPKYAQIYNDLANGNWKGHNIIITSVTPVDENRYRSGFNSKIKEFNTALKNSLGNSVSYCNIYDKVLALKNQYTPDGLHYSTSASKEIYNYKKECLLNK